MLHGSFDEAQAEDSRSQDSGVSIAGKRTHEYALSFLATLGMTAYFGAATMVCGWEQLTRPVAAVGATDDRLLAFLCNATLDAMASHAVNI